jgi:parvulin-like peptidyl-prolyl isomerase
MKIRPRHWGVASLLVLAVLGACSKNQEEQQPQPQAQVPPGEQHRVRHILVQYRGAQSAGEKTIRSKTSADSLLKSLRERVLAGVDFGDLARKYSDDASAPEGGEIAPLQPGDTPPDFEKVAFALQPGDLSVVFESPVGFHLIQRLGGELIGVEHILVTYHGAQGAPDTLQRTRTEALTRIDKILTDLQNPDSSFPVAAAHYSDDLQTAFRGGYMGEFARGRIPKGLEDAAFALQPDQTSKVIETPEGFHILKRVKLESVRVEHILVTHALSDGLEHEGLRSEPEALQRALDVLFRAKKGEDFEKLAQEMSDDKMTAPKGGRLPPLSRGQAVPEFEEIAFGLKPGEISNVVRTPFGFHIIRRMD